MKIATFDILERKREKRVIFHHSHTLSEQFYKQYCIGNLEIGIYFSIELGVRMWTAMADSFPFLHSIPSLSTSTSHSCLSPPHFLIMNHFNPAQQKIPASRISKSRECVDETRWLIGTTIINQYNSIIFHIISDFSVRYQSITFLISDNLKINPLFLLR